MQALPTAKCSKWPPHLLNAKPAMLCPDLSDEDIDTALKHIHDKELGQFRSARTQYGRRIQVDMFRELEKRKPEFSGNNLILRFAPRQAR